MLIKLSNKSIKDIKEVEINYYVIYNNKINKSQKCIKIYIKKWVKYSLILERVKSRIKQHKIKKA